MPSPPGHSAFLSLDDAELLRQCEVDRFRGTGPGGQKRNKTETAVRLRHGPSGLCARSDETRSQHHNRSRALALLRERIALELREPVVLDESYVPADDLRRLVAGGRAAPGRRSPAYLPAVAALLDLFVAVDCSVRETAARLDATTGAVSRVLLADPRLARAANALRARRGLRLLR